jgi:hypothetical protein
MTTRVFRQKRQGTRRINTYEEGHPERDRTPDAEANDELALDAILFGLVEGRRDEGTEHGLESDVRKAQQSPQLVIEVFALIRQRTSKVNDDAMQTFAIQRQKEK